MVRCECCYHSELIDGTLYCHNKEEDVLFQDECESYVNFKEVISLHFNIICNCKEELAEELGRELALFLQESWFNGEDVLEVEFKDYDIIN